MNFIIERKTVGEDMKKKRYLLQEILNVSLYLLIVLILTLLVVRFVGERTRVNGDSMETTLSDGDNLIVNKIQYRFSQPERFDIVVFSFKYANQTYYIKRIIGLPGETVQIKDSVIYINDEPLEESYGIEAMKDAGLKENIRVHRLSSSSVNVEAEVYEVMKEAKERGVEAFIFPSKRMAILAFSAMQALDMRFNKDVDCVCFDESDVYNLSVPPIPHIVQPLGEIALRAFNLFQKMLKEDVPPEEKNILLKTEFIK